MIKLAKCGLRLLWVLKEALRMRYKTRFYLFEASFHFETLEELRYKEIVRTYLVDVLIEEVDPLDKFELYEAITKLKCFLKDPEALIVKITGPDQVCVYRWDQQRKPIITVTINSENVDKPGLS